MDIPIPGEDTPERTASFIGIVVAISGNIVISLALNCQKLAHKRIEQQQLERASPASSNSRSSLRSTPNGKSPRGAAGAASAMRSARPSNSRRGTRDTTPLKPLRSSFAKYGAAVSSNLRFPGFRRTSSRKSSNNSGYEVLGTSDPDDEHDIRGNGLDGDDEEPSYFNSRQPDDGGPRAMMASPLLPNDRMTASDIEEEEEDLHSGSSDEEPEKQPESNYLKSKLWYAECLCLGLKVRIPTICTGGLVSSL